MERNIDGFSLKQLFAILLVFLYGDMTTTYIGYHLGLVETNIILKALLLQTPILVFVYPIFVSAVCYIIYLIFQDWETEMKMGYLFLLLMCGIAIATNLTHIIIDLVI